MASKNGGRVAVTGVASLVGGQIARQLVDEEVEVSAIVEPGAPRWHLITGAINWHEIDVDAPPEDALRAALTGAGALIIADADRAVAGITDAQEARLHAVRWLRLLLHAAIATQVPRVVLISSERTLDGSAIEGPARLPEDHGDAGTQAMIAMEAEVYRYVAGGMNLCIVAAGLALGPGDVRGQALGAWAAPLTSVPEGVLHPCDARDIAQAAIAAARKGRAGRRYPLIGRSLTLAEFATTRAEHAGGGDVSASLSPWPPAWALRPAEMQSDQSAGELGVRPRPLALTLRDAGRWYRQTGMLSF